MSRSRWVHALAGLVMLAGLVAPTGATAASPGFVVTAARSAWTDVVVPQPLHLVRSTFSLRTTSPYTVLLVEAAEPQKTGFFSLFAVAVRGRFDERRVFATSQTIQPGRYRVRLITAAPATVGFDVVGGSLRLRPRHPLRAVVSPVGPVALPVGPHDQVVRQRGAVPRRMSGLLVVSTSGQGVDGSYACATSAPRCDGVALPLVPSSLDPQPLGAGTAGGTSAAFLGPDDAHVRDVLYGIRGVWADPGRFVGCAVAYSP